MTELSAGKLWGMRRLADAGGRFKMLAVDQRPPTKDPIRAARGTQQVPYEEVAAFKQMLIEELQGDASAVLLDPHYALPRGLSLLSPAKGMIVTLEDSSLRETGDGRDWSVEKIKRVGGDAVKVLAWYRPDAGANVCRAQEGFAMRIGGTCRRFDIPFLFELLVYPLPGEGNQTQDYVEMAAKQADNVLESVRRFVDPGFGIDVFKLESPVPASGVGDGNGAAVQKLFDEMGRLAGGPWMMLSAGAGMAAFEAVLKHVYRAGASGYLAGRVIWAEPLKAFPDWGAIRSGLRDASRSYMRRINVLTDAVATPWFAHPRFGGQPGGVAQPDASFPNHYAEMGTG